MVIRAYVFFRSSKSSATFDRAAPGRSISTPPGVASLFHRGSYRFGGIRRSRVVMEQQIGSSRLSMVRTRCHPLVAHGTPRSSHRTSCHDDGLDHRNSRRRSRLCCSMPPRGGRTAGGAGLTASLWAWDGRIARGAGLTVSLCSWGGQTVRRALGLTVSLYVRQAIPDYRGTLRYTRDYPSTTAILLIFSITDRDCVALPNIDISMLAPSMDEVADACPPACNNNDARGRAIYVGAVARWHHLCSLS
jgi:hypothetical protein